MILLLGADGYIGQGLSRELATRRVSFVPLSRDTLDYSKFEVLFDYVRSLGPKFIINSPADDVRANGLENEDDRLRTLMFNTLLPQSIARVCKMTNTPFGHVSSGRNYTGAKVLSNGQFQVEPELNQPHLRKLFESCPDRFVGFTEEDAPNASFRSPSCTFRGGAEALAEDVLRDCPRTYVWRAHMAFNEKDDPSNFLAKVLRSQAVHEEITSLTHVQDFARACLDLWETDAQYGIYNVVNPGAVSTRQVVKMIHEILMRDCQFEYCPENGNSNPSKSLQPSCILDSSKLLRAGVTMRTVEAALSDSIKRWGTSGTDLLIAQRQSLAKVIELESVRKYLDGGSEKMASDPLSAL